MKPLSDLLSVSAKGYQFVDTAQPGDICVLLIPGYTEAGLLKLRLQGLKKRFGGEIASPLHLTCQRFRAEAEALAIFKPKLIHLASQTQLLALEAKSIEPFYSSFHEQELLKCRIVVSKALQDFIEQLNKELEDSGISPHLPWIPELVTLLEMTQIGQWQKEIYSKTLFLGQRLVLTQIEAPGSYKALFSVALSSMLVPDLKS